MVRFAALGACATLGIVLGCGGKSAPSSPGTGPSVAVPCAAPSTPTVLHQGVVSGLAVVDGRALFIDQSLQSVPLAGGAPRTLVEGDELSGLVTTSDTAFFTGRHAAGAVTPEGKQPTEASLYSVPIAGGAATFIRDQFFFSYGAADSTSVYLADAIGKVLEFTPPAIATIELPIGDKLSVRDLAVNSTDVFAAVEDLSNVSAPTGGIVKIAKGGGSARIIVTTAGLPDAIAADDSGVFWVEDPPVGTFGNGHIARADLDGGHVKILVDQGGAAALAVDANYVYALSDSLSQIPKTTGGLEPIAGGFSGAGALRIAGADAVWIDRYTKALSDPTPSSVMAMCLHSTPHP